MVNTDMVRSWESRCTLCSTGDVNAVLLQWSRSGFLNLNGTFCFARLRMRSLFLRVSGWKLLRLIYLLIYFMRRDVCWTRIDNSIISTHWKWVRWMVLRPWMIKVICHRMKESVSTPRKPAPPTAMLYICVVHVYLFSCIVTEMHVTQWFLSWHPKLILSPKLFKNSYLFFPVYIFFLYF